MMQKKILVLAVVAAIAAPAAFADTANVTIYGLAHMAFQSVDNGSSAAGAGTSAIKVSSETSKLGFKGSEDLGDGLSAIWQIESMIAMDNAGGTFGTRNTFAGLKSDSMGTVLLGKHDTPYKIATRKLDVFGDTIADNRSLMGGGATATGAALHDARTSDTLAYISPAMNGFTVAAAYVAGAETAAASADIKGSAWSLAGMYDAGPLYAALAYQVVDQGSAGTSTGQTLFTTVPSVVGGQNFKATAWRMGAGYTMDALQVNAIYEKTSDNFTAVTGGDKYGRGSYYVSGKYSFGSDAVKLAYTSAGKQTQSGVVAGTDTAAKQFSVGYDHSLSKRTTVYALYTKLSNNLNASYGLSTAGSTGGAAAKGADADPSAWSLGMKHSF